MPLGPYERKQIKAMHEEITTLRQQLEQLKKRAIELEQDNAHQRGRRNAARDCIRKMKAEHQLEILRKQAEAVESFSVKLSGTRNQRLAKSESDRLRLRACELENTGGEP